MGAMRLMEPIALATTPMLLAAAGGIASELVALKLLYPRQKGNLNMQGAYWHIVQTFVGSRSEEHTSELQSLMRISYAVFCLKTKKNKTNTTKITQTHIE